MIWTAVDAWTGVSAGCVHDQIEAFRGNHNAFAYDLEAHI